MPSPALIQTLQTEDRTTVPHRLLAALALVVCAAPAAAQGVTFVPRTAFHLTAAHITSEDERLVWDTNFGGELDIVDYGVGRAGVLANYQAMLGEELHAFDPNQGNYTLAASASARVKRLEAALVFHHVSRHLSDRDKVQPVDWNMVGGRLQTTAIRQALRVNARLDVRGVVQRSYVDYQWEVEGAADARYRLRPTVALITAGSVRRLGVDGSRDRDAPTGFRGEGGIRFEGGAGAIELFVAGERRIDPHPLEFGTDHWFSAGFRLLSR